MKVALVGAELEENLGLSYMAAALEKNGHLVEIIPFNSERDTSTAVNQVLELSPELVGLSMVFTGRAREFCEFAGVLRTNGYDGHIIAGGHFAALNASDLLRDFPEFDSIGLGEGEDIICALVSSLPDYKNTDGICFRSENGEIVLNPSKGNPDDLDALPFPRRDKFHRYFGKPIASILSSRGCWRNCDFCSINAWYKAGGGKHFRVRSVENIVSEMSVLYKEHDVRIFNFQDDNFYLPSKPKALARFIALRDGLNEAGIDKIAIAIKARPDSITSESLEVLDDLGLFRVFLGVENASERGLRNMNRRCRISDIEKALTLLNDFNIHVAYNFLMFEPDANMNDLLINLRFMERHLDNPFNFCRAEVYEGTGLAAKLRKRNKLLGDYFGFDYRIEDIKVETFHRIANHSFFQRNFSDFGLHYFNMQVDFYYQLLRRFYSEYVTETLRGDVKSFIKRTNLDTHQALCRIYDFVMQDNQGDALSVQQFAMHMRRCVDQASIALRNIGEELLSRLEESYNCMYSRSQAIALGADTSTESITSPLHNHKNLPDWCSSADTFGLTPVPIPYELFRSKLADKSPYDEP